MKRLRLILAILLVVAGYPIAVKAQANSQEASEVGSMQTIPFKRDDTVSEKTLMRVGVVSVFGVILALAVLVVLKKFLKRISTGAGVEDRIHLRAVKRLTPKLMLLITRVDDKEYLIAQSGDRVSITLHHEFESGQNGNDC